MKKILLALISFLCVACLLISCKLFWNIAIYADEFNSSPNIIFGGHFWLITEWLNLFFLFLASCLSMTLLVREMLKNK